MDITLNYITLKTKQCLDYHSLNIEAAEAGISWSDQAPKIGPYIPHNAMWCCFLCVSFWSSYVV